MAKGAVVTTAERPERYRPLQPSALLALIAEREAGKLDRLEAQLSQARGVGAPGLVSIAGERSLLDLTMRTAARAAGPLTCIAPAKLLAGLAPAWHKRVGEKAETHLWVLGDPPAAPLPLEPRGQIDLAVSVRHFSAPVLLLLAPEAVVIAALLSSGPSGYWTSDPLLAATAQLAAVSLTGAPG